MASLFDFVIKNANQLEQIVLNDDGDIAVPVDEFDFSHPDTQVEKDNEDIVFTVPVGVFSMKARVNIDNLSDAAKYLKKITDSSLRREVIEAIEENYRADAEIARDEAQSTFDDAATKLALAQKDFDDVVDSLGELKGAWNVP